MKYARLVVLLGLWHVIPTIKGQDIVLGTRQKLYSEILQEERTVFIHLPKHYNDSNFTTSTYPVLYVLDGEFHFQQLSTIVDALSGGYYISMPEMIVVGIENTDRSRDFTPTRDTIMHAGRMMHGTSGGAETFLRFLTDELGNYMDTTFRTNGFNVITGHSFGGLFSVYAYLNHADFFQGYLAHDPSLWWDDQTLVKQAETLMKKSDFTQKSLYISMAGVDTTETDRFKHSETIRDFCDFLSQGLQNEGNFRSEYFGNEDHGTIPLPANYQGLKFLFEGITLPVKQVPDRVEVIEVTYQKLSEKLGHTFIPEAHVLDNLANYCMRVDKPESAVAVRKLFVKYYPENAYGHLALAESYAKVGMHDLAREAYKNARDINPDLKDKNL